MNRQRFLAWLVAVAAVLTVLVIWFGRRNEVAVSPTVAEPSPAPPAKEMASPERTHHPATLPAQTSPSPATPTSASVAAMPEGSQAEQRVNILSNYNDVPIVFYGRLEDQFGTAVAGATVNFSVRVYNGYESTVNRGQVVSDGTGGFTISGYKGESLSLDPEKHGYALSSAGTLFKYSRLEESPFEPEAGNPTVIRMWKLQGAEQLIRFDIQTDIPIDGTPIAFDLETGQRVQTGGDMSVSIQSSMAPNIREEYDWRFTLRPVNGGVIENNGVGFEKTFQAPETGYKLEYVMDYQKGTPTWSAAFSGGFLVMSRNAKCYAKCALQISTYRVENGAVPITLRGYLNPAGSRNLEVAPALLTEAHP